MTEILFLRTNGNPSVHFNAAFVASRWVFIQAERCLLDLNSSSLLFIFPSLRDEMEKDLKKLKVGSLWSRFGYLTGTNSCY